MVLESDISRAAKTPTFKPCVGLWVMHVADMSSWLSANAAQTRASVHGGMSSSRSVSAVYTVCIDVALDDWYSAFAFLPSLRDNIVFVCALSSKGFIELCANAGGADEEEGEDLVRADEDAEMMM